MSWAGSAVDHWEAAPSTARTGEAKSAARGSCSVAQMPRAPSPAPAGPPKAPTTSHIPESTSRCAPARVTVFSSPLSRTTRSTAFRAAFDTVTQGSAGAGGVLVVEAVVRATGWLPAFADASRSMTSAPNAEHPLRSRTAVAPATHPHVRIAGDYLRTWLAGGAAIS